MLNISHQKNHSSESFAQNLCRSQIFDKGFSEVLARELKAPLDATLGMLDLLLTTEMTLKQKEYLEVACSSGRSLMDLIDSVLIFSDIQAGNVEVIQQDCHIAEILDEVVDRLAEKALKQSINLGYVLPKNFTDVVITDPSKVQQILVQLLDNAIKFTHFGDDFGSGFSSLNHLREIPVDVLKIDRLFTTDIETNVEDQAIVKNIINLAQELSIQTVAEGVETEGQKAMLTKLNCHFFQGFLVSKPIKAKEFCQQFLKVKNYPAS